MQFLASLILCVRFWYQLDVDKKKKKNKKFHEENIREVTDIN